MFIVVIKDQFVPIQTLIQYKKSSNFVDVNVIKTENEIQVKKNMIKFNLILE